jgi:hypothetical protein
MPYIGKSPTGSGVRQRYHYTATGGETSLSGADDNSKTLKFSDGEYVDVYLNGVLLVQGTDYGVGTANTISSLAALAANDIVEVIVYDIYNVAKINSEAVRSRHYFTATGGETSIGTSQIGGLSFPANADIDVKLNGVTLVAGTDYNTTTANTVGGLTALTAGQVVEIVIYEKFQLADTVSKASGGTFGGPVTFDGDLNAGTIKEATGTNTAITIDSTGFASGLMVNAGRQSLASSNGYTWTGIPSTAKRIIVVYRLFYTQAADANKTTLLRVGDGSIVTSGYKEVSSFQDGASDGSNTDGTGFHTYYWTTGNQSQFGKYELTYLHGNGWVVNGLYTITEAASAADAVCGVHSGYIGLTGALDRVQLKIKDGTTTYNANSEAVLYYMG